MCWRRIAACGWWWVWGLVFVPAQAALPDVVEELVGQMAWQEENDLEGFYERLVELYEHPIDLNQATKEDIDALPFLTALEKEQLAYHLFRHRPLSSLSELRLVDGWDASCYQKIKPFVCLNQPVESKEAWSLKDCLTKGQFQWKIRTESGLQDKRGYVNDDSLRALSKAYLGNRLAQSSRFSYQWHDQLRYGLTFEKDAGERGFDHYSAYVSIYRLGKLKQLHLGDYRANLGHGLCLSSGQYGGKMAASDYLCSRSKLFLPHSSVAESGFLRGLAIEVALSPHYSVAGFVSYRGIDTHSSDASFLTLKTDGLHRTQKEWEAKNRHRLCQSGGRFSWEGSQWQVSLNALFYAFNATIQAEPKPYNLLYFRGQRGHNLSVDARAAWQRLLLSGEWAIDHHLATACIFSLSYAPVEWMETTLSWRHYAPDYQAPFASALSSGSRISNEQAWFAQCCFELPQQIHLKVLADVCHFPWLRYGVPMPSQETELCADLEWSISKQLQASLRCKEKHSRQHSAHQSIRQQTRLQLSWQNEQWKLRQQIDFNRIRSETKPHSYGKAWTQELVYRVSSKGLSTGVQGGLFDTDGYDNAVWLYRMSPQDCYPLVGLSGKGYHAALLFRWQCLPSCRVELGLHHTVYHDRGHLSSGLERIEGSRQTKLLSALKVKKQF